MSYTFHGLGYDTEQDAAREIIVEWLTAGGSNSAKTVHRFLATTDNDDILDELVECWAIPVSRPALVDALHDVRAGKLAI